MAQYYDILNVNKSATYEEICKAYRNLALKYHPSQFPYNVSENVSMFSKIAESYEVLSNPQWKAIYDQYGEKILKNGISNNKGSIPIYVFRGNAE